MQMVSSVLAAPISILGNLFSPFLADGLNPAGIAGIAGVGIVVIILGIVVSIPLYLLVSAIPMWVAAKIAVTGRTTYGMAIKVVLSRLLAAIVIFGVGAVIMFLVAAAGGKDTAPVVVGLIYAALLLALFVANLLIIAGAYDIGIFHAFGIQLLAFVITLVSSAVLSFGGIALFGTGGTNSPLQALLQKAHDFQQNGDISKVLPSFNNPEAQTPAPVAALTPTPVDNSAEIDSLLNAALHPDGPRPSLDERENIVRSLQEKLRLQKSSLPAGDAHAMLVFQNQLNRYMALLETVRLERKLHPLRDEVVTQKPIGRDYASPAP